MLQIKDTKEVKSAVPLKHLGNFWNSLNIPLVNSEASLALSWSETYVITSMGNRILVENQQDRGDSPTNATIKRNDTILLRALNIFFHLTNNVNLLNDLINNISLLT